MESGHGFRGFYFLLIIHSFFTVEVSLSYPAITLHSPILVLRDPLACILALCQSAIGVSNKA